MGEARDLIRKSIAQLESREVSASELADRVLLLATHYRLDAEKPDLAISQYRRVLDLCDGHSPELRLDALEGLAWSHYSMGEVSRALEYGVELAQEALRTGNADRQTRLLETSEQLLEASSSDDDKLSDRRSTLQRLRDEVSARVDVARNPPSPDSTPT